ncbi:hypothetical protein EW145_g5403 [Phellinidium pouzarii]|uniref:Uncharacterized protein n=1 Tax=Phellinidium pouzarii TaxID=167371 RepID=A0A4S4L1F1_9AGAM|nr:hypothetical protein EW145_g5403 [Phellinidium pouzarii]
MSAGVTTHSIRRHQELLHITAGPLTGEAVNTDSKSKVRLDAGNDADDRHTSPGDVERIKAGKRRRSDKQKAQYYNLRKSYKKTRYERDIGDDLEGEIESSQGEDNDDCFRKKDSATEHTILFRMRNGDLQQIRCMRTRYSHTRVFPSPRDRHSEDVSVYSFLTSNLRLSSEDNDNILKEDLDIREIDWEKKRLRCSACNKSFTLGGKHGLYGWLEHKVQCKSLQSIYRAEVERLDIQQRTRNTKGKRKVRTSKTLPDAKATKKALVVQQRRAILKADQLSGAVEPGRVWCKPCGKWLALVGRTYDVTNWKQHKGRIHCKGEHDQRDKDKALEPIVEEKMDLEHVGSSKKIKQQIEVSGGSESEVEEIV